MKGVQILCFSRTNIFQRKVEGMGKIKGFYVYSKRIFFLGGGMSHSSTHSYPRHYVEMHGKLYPPATLPSGKKFLLPNDWEAKYFLVQSEFLLSREKSPSPGGNQTRIRGSPGIGKLLVVLCPSNVAESLSMPI